MKRTRRKLEKLKEYTSVEGERIKILSGTAFTDGTRDSYLLGEEINVRYNTDVTRIVVDGEIAEEYKQFQHKTLSKNPERVQEILDRCAQDRADSSELIHILNSEIERLHDFSAELANLTDENRTEYSEGLIEGGGGFHEFEIID